MGTDLESGGGTTPLFAAMVGGAQNAPRNDTAGAEVHKKVERAVFKGSGKNDRCGMWQTARTSLVIRERMKYQLFLGKRATDVDRPATNLAHVISTLFHFGGRCLRNVCVSARV